LNLAAGPYYSSEVLKIQSELGKQKIGDLEVQDLVSLRERLNVAMQKDDYVKTTPASSLAA